MTVWDGAVSPFVRGQLYLRAWLSCRGRTGEGGSGYAPSPTGELLVQAISWKRKIYLNHAG